MKSAPVDRASRRWCGGSIPDYGLVAPDEFIPIAEHTGLIRLLTDHVLEAALRQCRSWRQLGFPLTMAVNLSVRNLMDRDLPDGSAPCSPRSGCRPSVLTLEITEGTIMADPVRTLEVLNRLAAMGITLVHRRLRHRLLVAVLPQAAPGARGQDRQELRAAHDRPTRTTR